MRLKVDLRGGGFGAKGPALRVGMRATEVVFLARGPGPFELALGRPGAISAALPLDTLVPGLRGDSLAKMGQVQVDGDLHVTQAVVEQTVIVQAQTDRLEAFRPVGCAAVGRGPVGDDGVQPAA